MILMDLFLWTRAFKEDIDFFIKMCYNVGIEPFMVSTLIGGEYE